MNDTPQDPTITTLPSFQANIEDELHFGLGDASWERAEEDFGLGYVAEETNLSAYLSLPADSAVVSLEGIDPKLETLDTDILAPLQQNFAGSGLHTHHHNEQTDTHYMNTTLDVPHIYSPQHKDAPLPTTEHPQIELRDAKQLLAEQAAEREKKKRARATEFGPPRKRARKTSKAPAAVLQDSVEQHHAPYTTDPAPEIAPTTPSAHLAPPSPNPIPSSTFLSGQELCLLSALLNALSISIDPNTDHTNTRLDTLTCRIWTALDNDRSITVQGKRLWEYIGDVVSAWPEGRLRMLAKKQIIPGWWWVREGVSNLVASAGRKLDDGKMKEMWKKRASRMRRSQRGGKTSK